MDHPIKQDQHSQQGVLGRAGRCVSKLRILCITLLSGSILSGSIALAGSTYIYKDKNGKTHITNVPTTAPGFKLVKTIATPVYKKVPTKQAEATESGTIQYDGNGWKLIAPSDGRLTAAMLAGSGSYKNSQPFSVNGKNRQRYAGVVMQAAKKYNLDPHLVHAVISAESAYNPRALSPAGAMGMMQLMPETAKRFGVSNAYDPVANIHAGTRYLRWLLNYFKGNVNLALAGYNAGEGAVVKYNYKIPPYKETQTYVARVLKFYQYSRSKGS